MAGTVAAAAVRWLAGAGARRAYTVPGESFLGLLDAVAAEPDLTLVSTRHESGAAFMAAAEAQLTGVPAIAMASRGPGATNLSIGVHTAHQDRTPLLVLLGQVASHERHRHALQEMDLAAFYAPITVFAAEARTPADLAALVPTAWHAATTGRRGPAAVIAPTDLWTAALPGKLDLPHATGARPPANPLPADQETADGETTDREATDRTVRRTAVERVAGLVAAARRPVVVAGTPARWHHADLVALADRLGLGVYTAFRRQDAFPEDHPATWATSAWAPPSTFWPPSPTPTSSSSWTPASTPSPRRASASPSPTSTSSWPAPPPTSRSASPARSPPSTPTSPRSSPPCTGCPPRPARRPLPPPFPRSAARRPPPRRASSTRGR